jgi:hypothetical protein
MFVVLLGKIVMWSVERQDESASDRQRSRIAAHMIRTLLTDSRRFASLGFDDPGLKFSHTSNISMP